MLYISFATMIINFIISIIVLVCNIELFAFVKLDLFVSMLF